MPAIVRPTVKSPIEALRNPLGKKASLCVCIFGRAHILFKVSRFQASLSPLIGTATSKIVSSTSQNSAQITSESSFAFADFRQEALACAAPFGSVHENAALYQKIN